MAALGATAAKNGCARLGLHAGEEAVGLGAVAAVGLEGTLRHDKNSCGRRVSCSNFLGVAAISEYTRWDGIFTGENDPECIFGGMEESSFGEETIDGDGCADGVCGV